MKTIDPKTTIDTTDTLDSPESSNDNGTCIATPDTTFLLGHREVVRYILGALRHYHVERQDLADALAEVQVAALEAARRGRMPASIAEWKALATTIAARQQIDRLREEEVNAKLESKITSAFNGTYAQATKHGVSMRTGAMIVGVGRVAEAVKTLGLWP